jgi:hypothetical protein
LPEFVRQGGDIVMSESHDAVPHSCFMTLPLLLLRVFEHFPGMLVSCEIWLFSIVFANAVRVGGAVFEFGRALVILVM